MKKGMICHILLIGITMFALVACGTGDLGGLAGGGIGGTGISVGKITAFGSVFVNGVKFETAGATITIDGQTAMNGQDDLEIGMIVAVEGTFNVDGVRGTAKSIKFKDNLEGPVTSTNTTNTLMVLGQTVVADATTDIYGANSAKITFAAILTGDTVEVSGFVDSTGVIHATYIKVKGSAGAGEIELKGTISELDVTPGTFKIGTLVVDYSGAQIEVTDSLQNGLFVEVKSNAEPIGGMLIASKVEAEDEIFSIAGEGEGEKAELEGVVTSVTNLVSENKFEVNGQPVQITSATHFEGNTSQAEIILGARLEVEGTVDANGVLIAKEISIESGDGNGEGDSDDSPDDGSDNNDDLPDDESDGSGS